MAITAISIDEAFAQGSSWSQMLSISKFHKDEINRKLKAAREAIARMADWKARRFKQELDATIRAHHEYADHFDRLAGRMKSIEDEARRISTGGARNAS